MRNGFRISELSRTVSFDVSKIKDFRRLHHMPPVYYDNQAHRKEVVLVDIWLGETKPNITKI